MAENTAKQPISEPQLDKPMIIAWVPDQNDPSNPFTTVAGRRIHPSGTFQPFTVQECMLSRVGSEYLATPVPQGKTGLLPKEANLTWIIQTSEEKDPETKETVIKLRGPWAEIELAGQIFYVYPTQLWSNGWAKINDGLDGLEEETIKKILAYRRAAQQWRWPRKLPKNGETIKCRLLYSGKCSYGGTSPNQVINIMAYPI